MNRRSVHILIIAGIASLQLLACSEQPSTLVPDAPLAVREAGVDQRVVDQRVEPDQPPPPPPMFAEPFETILQRLLADFWSADGDWQGDMQGDATAFAPALLFALGLERGDADLTARAVTTVKHEIELVEQLIQTTELTQGALIGFPALADGHTHGADSRCETLLSLGLIAGHSIITTKPETILPYLFDLATVYGTGSYMSFIGYEALGVEVLKDKGLDLIARADAECWDEEQGLYSWTEVPDWPQATMMLALTRAYRATGDAALLTRCERILQSMKGCCWDEEQGGYFGHWGQEKKGLSGNNNMTWALLELYDLTGQAEYLQTAQRILEWILTADIYAADEGLLYHHWEDTTGEHPGRADYYCTGCNFSTLLNIHRFNELRARSR